MFWIVWHFLFYFMYSVCWLFLSIKFKGAFARFHRLPINGPHDDNLLYLTASQNQCENLLSDTISEILTADCGIKDTIRCIEVQYVCLWLKATVWYVVDSAVQLLFRRFSVVCLQCWCGGSAHITSILNTVNKGRCVLSRDAKTMCCGGFKGIVQIF